MGRMIGTPRRSRYRWILAAAALVAAAAHVPVIAPHLEQAAYMGVLFIVLTAACLTLTGTALVQDSSRVYALATLTCGLALVGYAATRLVAFPMLAEDVGNWLEPLGIVASCAEAVVVVSAVLALRPQRTDPPLIATA